MGSVSVQSEPHDRRQDEMRWDIRWNAVPRLVARNLFFNHPFFFQTVPWERYGDQVRRTLYQNSSSRQGAGYYRVSWFRPRRPCSLLVNSPIHRRACIALRCGFDVLNNEDIMPGGDKAKDGRLAYEIPRCQWHHFRWSDLIQVARQNGISSGMRPLSEAWVDELLKPMVQDTLIAELVNRYLDFKKWSVLKPRLGYSNTSIPSNRSTGNGVPLTYTASFHSSNQDLCHQHETKKHSVGKHDLKLPISTPPAWFSIKIQIPEDVFFSFI